MSSCQFTTENRRASGFALVAVLLMTSVLLALLSAYSVITRVELSTGKASFDSARGFYAAEAGLNIRAEQVRQTFLGYNRPDGTSPTGPNKCQGGNVGSGNFVCQEHTFGNHRSVTYVEEDPGNPVILTIPPGERYQNLNAQEYRYTVVSQGLNRAGDVEAILELRFKSRLVPLFQFAAFYNKDLEILPGPVMMLQGPVHVNGDLYLNTHDRLDIAGQVTTSGALWRGRKNDSTCDSKPVRIANPTILQALLPSCSGRTEISANNLVSWNGMIQRDVTPVDVPSPEVLDPTPGQIYWDKADVRIVMQLNSSNNPVTTYSPNGVQLRNPDNSVNVQATNNLQACSGGVSGKVIGYTNTFYNNREGGSIRMLEVDMRGLLNCAYTVKTSGVAGPILKDGRALDDDSEGGLVLYFTVKGPNSNAQKSFYGVRIRNAAELQSTVGAAPDVKGLTVVSDQAVYTHGHYNAANKIPAAILADAFNVLSTGWNLNDTTDTQNVNNRTANHTTINSAVLAGTDSTGGVEGPGGQGGAYNGGLENYPRFHENWSGRTLTYYGSFVSLNKTRHSGGAWVYGNPQYTAPNRDWHYDTDFNDAANLPPITPRFVYLRQQLFLREFEQDS